jgi:hypothetical protein
MNLEVSSCTKYFGTGDQEVREYRSQEFGTRLQEVRSGTNQKRGSHLIDYEVKKETRKSGRGGRYCKRGSRKRDQHPGSQNQEPKFRTRIQEFKQGFRKLEPGAR